MSRREALERESERLKRDAKRRDVSFWRPAVGRNVVRILPHWSGDMETVFFKKARVHFGVGPDKNRVICRKNLSGRDVVCPVCDYVDELLQSGRREDAFIARDIMARERFIVNIVDVEDPKAGVQVWEMGKGLFNDVLLLFLDEEYGDLDNLDSGRHIIVKRTGEGKLDTRYNVVPSSAVTRVPQKVLEKLHDLDALYPVPKAEEISATLYGEEYYEEEGEDILAEEGAEGESEIGEPESEEETESPSGSEEVEELEIPLEEEEEKDEEPAKTEARSAGRKPAAKVRQTRPTSSRAERLREMRKKVDG